jgi:hypothetical protein
MSHAPGVRRRGRRRGPAHTRCPRPLSVSIGWTLKAARENYQELSRWTLARPILRRFATADGLVGTRARQPKTLGT